MSSGIVEGFGVQLWIFFVSDPPAAQCESRDLKKRCNVIGSSLIRPVVTEHKLRYPDTGSLWPLVEREAVSLSPTPSVSLLPTGNHVI